MPGIAGELIAAALNTNHMLWRSSPAGSELEEVGNKAGALQNYRKGLAIIEDLSLRDPSNLQIQAKLSETLVGLGLFLAKNGNEPEGPQMISRGLLISKLLADRPEAIARELDDYAENLLTCDPGGPCDAAAALPYAKRAVEMTKASDPGYLDSLARAYFKTGDPAKAVETEEKALLLLPPSGSEKDASPTRKQYEANLAMFKKAPRHPGR